MRAYTQGHIRAQAGSRLRPRRTLLSRLLARGRHWLLSSSQSLFCVRMIVNGVGHVCSHVIACFLLKFPCQTLSLFSLSLASYPACQGRPITAPLARLVSIRGPRAGSPSRRALGRLGCQEPATGIRGCELQLRLDQLGFLVAGPNIRTRET